MSQYNIQDPDTLLECPYDKTHMVAAKRFPYHLQKCRKQHSGRDFVSCPFNAKHEMPKPELRYHMANCPDRAMIEPDIAFEEGKNKENGGTLFKGCTDVPSYNNWKPPSPSENWDKESSKYPRIGIPEEVLEKCRTHLGGMTKGEKKEYHKKLLSEKDAGKDNENKELRRPQTTGQAQQLSQQRMQLLDNPPAPNSVFAYSLSTVGIGRGRGRTDVETPAGASGISSPAPIGLARGQNIGPPLAMRPQNYFLQQSEPQNFGIGRGIMSYANRESPSFIVPKVKPMIYSNMYDSAGDSQASSGENSDLEFSNVSADVRDAKIKKQKRLIKKLKQIENLMQLRLDGKQLNEEEEAKIQARGDIEKELDSLK